MTSDSFTLQIFDAGIAIPASHASTHSTGGTDPIPVATASAVGLMSAAQVVALNANSAKVSNATHTGDVTGSGALTISTGAVTAAKIAAGAVSGDKLAAASVTETKVAAGAISFGKIANVGQFVVLGRNTSGSGSVAAVSCTALGFEIIGSSNPLEVRSILELGNLATQDALAVNLATDVGTSTLPVVNGGTGGLVVQNPYALLAAGIASNGAFRTLGIGDTTQILVGGGSGAFPAWTTATGTGSPVRAVSPTLTTPVLGTPAAGSVLTNCTGLPLTAGVVGVLPIANGGTGKTSAVRGQISKMSSFTLVGVTTNVYAPIANAGTLSANVNTTVGAGSTFSIKNTSNTTRLFRVYASVDATSAINNILGVKLYFGVAGSLSSIDETECRGFTSASNDAAKLVTSWMIELDHNEEIAVYVANHSGTGSITIQRARLIVEAII